MRAYSSLLKEGDMKKRWLIYAVIGILFGVADFFYQGLMQNLSPLALQLALILGKTGRHRGKSAAGCRNLGRSERPIKEKCSFPFRRAAAAPVHRKGVGGSA